MRPQMSDSLAEWNAKDKMDAISEMLACCGSRAWAEGVVAGRPYGSEDQLRLSADSVWQSLDERDWLEAFSCHPRIGERAATGVDSDDLRTWSAQEQSLVANAGERVLEEIARGNREYEARFGFTYIVCATGKPAEQMLDILSQRLKNDRGTEVREAAEQQRQIMQLRLDKSMYQIMP